MHEKNNIIIVLFRNDLRVRDNEALYQACQDAEQVIPLYCVDPRHFKSTKYGFPKTGKYRSQFLIESLRDLRFQLQDLGADLVIKHGKPEEVCFALAKYHRVKAVYCQQEVTSEEIHVEDRLEYSLETIATPIDFFWGQTLYHYDDHPFGIDALPDIFTQYRKSIEKRGKIRATFPIPQHIQFPEGISVGEIPTLESLGHQTFITDKRTAILFKGGETAALQRLKHYFWEADHLKNYKETRNGLLGADYSSKFAPWLSLGCISPRSIYEEVQRYEEERVKNKSTYWLIFELLWRDYFRLVAMRYQTAIFKKGGIQNHPRKYSKNEQLLEKWITGTTGVPFVDANMRELLQTGFMSNRGRQNVASFLVKDLHLDWRIGAAWFESLLIDYDPCSNYGNWNYVAGIGNDPRENRYFNVLTQSRRYDPDGLYIRHWCPELTRLPSSMIHEPYLLNKVEQKYLNVYIGKNYPDLCIPVNKWKAKAKKRIK